MYDAPESAFWHHEHKKHRHNVDNRDYHYDDSDDDSYRAVHQLRHDRHHQRQHSMVSSSQTTAANDAINETDAMIDQGMEKKEEEAEEDSAASPAPPRQQITIDLDDFEDVEQLFQKLKEMRRYKRVNKVDYAKNLFGVSKETFKIREFTNLLLFATAGILFVALVDTAVKASVGLAKCRISSTPAVSLSSPQPSSAPAPSK